MATKTLGALAAIALVAACGADPSAGPVLATVGASPAAPTPSIAVNTPTPSPSPTHAKPSPVPRTTVVSFSGLPMGRYPVHLHSACSASQGFHITVEQSLVINASGRGKIVVTTSSFGRGLCLIVYSSSSLTRVLIYRRI
jgi:hypothetical protein